LATEIQTPKPNSPKLRREERVAKRVLAKEKGKSCGKRESKELLRKRKERETVKKVMRGRVGSSIFFFFFFYDTLYFGQKCMLEHRLRML
jgi:hypothetical protein